MPKNIVVFSDGTSQDGGARPLVELSVRDCMLPGPENGLRRVVDAACAAEGVRPRVLTEVDCVAALKQLVERRVGPTVLPFGAVHREVAEGVIACIPYTATLKFHGMVQGFSVFKAISASARVP